MRAYLNIQIGSIGATLRPGRLLSVLEPQILNISSSAAAAAAEK